MLGGCVPVAEPEERLGAGGEAGRSGAPARRAHPPAATPPRAPPPPALRAAPGRSGRRLLLLLGSRGSRAEQRARVAGLRGRPDTAGDARARPGGAGAVRWTGDSASEPGARPTRAPPTPRRRHPLLLRARRARSPGPTPHPPASPAALPLAVLEGPQPAEAGKARDAPPRRAQEASRDSRALPLPAAGSPGPAPARPEPGPGPAARRGNWGEESWLQRDRPEDSPAGRPGTHRGPDFPPSDWSSAGGVASPGAPLSWSVGKALTLAPHRGAIYTQAFFDLPALPATWKTVPSSSLAETLDGHPDLSLPPGRASKDRRNLSNATGFPGF